MHGKGPSASALSARSQIFLLLLAPIYWIWSNQLPKLTIPAVDKHAGFRIVVRMPYTKREKASIVRCRSQEGSCELSTAGSVVSTHSLAQNTSLGTPLVSFDPLAPDLSGGFECGLRQAANVAVSAANRNPPVFNLHVAAPISQQQPCADTCRKRAASLDVTALHSQQFPVVTDPKQLPIYGQHAEPEALRKLPLVASASGWEAFWLAQLAFSGGELLGERVGWVKAVMPAISVVECSIRGQQCPLVSTDAYSQSRRYVKALRKRVWERVRLPEEDTRPDEAVLARRAMQMLETSPNADHPVAQYRQM